MRYFLLSLLSFTLIFFSFTDTAHAKRSYFMKTSDLNHKGYFDDGDSYISVGWKEIKTDCRNCEELVDQLNKGAQQLFDLRHSAALAKKQAKEMKDFIKHVKALMDPANKDKLSKWNKRDLKEFKKLESSAILTDNMLSIGEIEDKLPEIEAQIKSMYENLLNLQSQIKECEKTCKGGPEDDEIIGSLGEDGFPQKLPIDWKGPYSADCMPCFPLVDHINSLPAIAIKEKAKLDQAIAEKQEQEIEKMRIQISTDGMPKKAAEDMEYYDEKGHHVRGSELMEALERWKKEGLQRLRKDIDKMNEKIYKAEQRIKRHESNIEKIKANFKESVSRLTRCNETMCKKEKTKKISCEMPETENISITVGPNNEVGSGAKFSNDLKNKAKGMAMGALGGALGGAGMSVGGGSDGIGSPMDSGGQDGPPTDKDITKGPYIGVDQDGVELAVRYGLLGSDLWNKRAKDVKGGSKINDTEGYGDFGNLLISTNIDDAPGDGTFQTQFIQDYLGNIYFPTHYLIFDLYRNWKLSIWWDYKRWQDDQLVEHRTGDSLTVGRDYLGRFEAMFMGKKALENAMWSIFGFKTTKKGVQTAGTIFDLPPDILSSGCPLRLVNYITMPNEDPVVALPFVLDLDLPDADGEMLVPFEAQEISLEEWDEKAYKRDKKAEKYKKRDERMN